MHYTLLLKIPTDDGRHAHDRLWEAYVYINTNSRSSALLLEFVHPASVIPALVTNDAACSRSPWSAQRIAVVSARFSILVRFHTRTTALCAQGTERVVFDHGVLLA